MLLNENMRGKKQNAFVGKKVPARSLAHFFLRYFFCAPSRYNADVTAAARARPFAPSLPRIFLLTRGPVRRPRGARHGRGAGRRLARFVAREMCNTQIRGDKAIKWPEGRKGAPLPRGERNRKATEGKGRKGVGVKGKGGVGIAGWALRKVAAEAQHKFEMLHALAGENAFKSVTSFEYHPSFGEVLCYQLEDRFHPLLLPPSLPLSSLSPLRRHDDDEGRR